jgi:GTP cyclohydrolase I
MGTFDKNLPDVALGGPGQELGLSLDAVGMENVQTMVLHHGQKLPAIAKATVSLINSEARGIHMSRLYKTLSQLAIQELSWEWLHTRLDEMKASHQGLADAAHLQVDLQLPVLRASLLSEQSGWRTYPVRFCLDEDAKGRRASLELRVLYSSTCPCSAALSQQALRDAFAGEFAEDRLSREQVLNWLSGSAATVAVAHAQRSEAHCRLVFARGHETHDLVGWIDVMESALGTPVQTAVKREDEQEFARLNARHLMFCEDAARKLKRALLSRQELADFDIEVRHFESLYPADSRKEEIAKILAFIFNRRSESLWRN